MAAESPLADIAHLIQLSVAPVFLLTAVGTSLGVFSTRLGRIVDRARVLGDRAKGLSPAEAEAARAEIQVLFRRRRLVNLAITCGTVAALMVAGVIGSAFLGFLLGWKVSWAVATLFLAAVAFLMAALLLFLREVLLAAANVRSEHR
ncbi:MAG: DUF2721 domain-containing protein [Deltaproteobacteria bacterium]|nr:DUF2721 domain-containing protein [Deltaproteobacteria bacterium]